MTTYTFEAYGQSVTVEADGFDMIDEKRNATIQANEFLSALPEYIASNEGGAWFPKTTVNAFAWIEGNFFD